MSTYCTWNQIVNQTLKIKLIIGYSVLTMSCKDTIVRYHLTVPLWFSTQTIAIGNITFMFFHKWTFLCPNNSHLWNVVLYWKNEALHNCLTYLNLVFPERNMNNSSPLLFPTSIRLQCQCLILQSNIHQLQNKEKTNWRWLPNNNLSHFN